MNCIYNDGILDIFIDKCIYIIYIYSSGDNTGGRLQKWENSDGIRIPKSILNSLNIKTNDIFDIEKVDEKIVISLFKKKKLI